MCPAVCWIWGARLAREKRGRRAGKTQLLGFSLERSRKFSIDPCPSCLKRLETKGLVFQPTCTEYQLHVAIYLANHIICPAASRHCLVGDEVGKRVAFEFQSRLLKAFQKESFFSEILPVLGIAIGGEPRSTVLFFFCPSHNGLWDLSSQIRDQICAPCSGSTES